MMPSATWTAAGIDGTSQGWIAVLVDRDLNVVDMLALRSIDEIDAKLGHAAYVAIDVPIGLSARGERGGRECDRAARGGLGHPRGSSVFPTPCRPAVYADTFPEACSRNAAPGDGPRLSRQTWEIVPKIREVDRYLRHHPECWDRVREIHPEVSFQAMNDGVPCLHRKGCPQGRQERLNLLGKAGIGVSKGLLAEGRRLGAAPHDVLDALAAAWTAVRIVRGVATALPGSPPPVDGCGLPMAIWV
jgi:predicted RNase H-like nuclease